jgi:hypothetical protein
MAKELKRPKEYATPIEGRFLVGIHQCLVGLADVRVMPVGFDAVLALQKKHGNFKSLHGGGKAPLQLYRVIKVDGQGKPIAEGGGE